MFANQYLKDKSKDFFRAVDIPENLNDVLHIDEESEVDAEEAGLSHANVNAIWSAVEGFYKTGMHPGIAFCLRKNGKIVLNRTLGHTRGVRAEEGLDAPVPMTTDTPICLYSASKAVMAMCVHKLAEENHIKLLDPVSHYLPEFGKNGKKNISIYQMLAHRGGFPLLDKDTPMDEMFDRDAILEQIYNTQVLCKEGRVQAYHAVTSGFIADELMRKTVGMPIEEYLKTRISDPMGLKGLRYGVAKKDQQKVARNYVTGMRNGKLIGGILENALGVSIEAAAELSNSEDFMNNVVPSANLYSTAEEINRFYQMMLDMGNYKNKQIMEPRTIQKATREAGRATFDQAIKIPMRFSAGFMLGGNPVGMYGRNTGHAFGHLGFSNIFCWADPERDISVSFLSTGKPVIGNHILALPKLMNAISGQCEPCETWLDD
ncbi:MAG: beta-lactamase family protein [Pseudomonadales bacterium]|nr:beta-lactamase family protein [Pseudomonadales bacterium]